MSSPHKDTPLRVAIDGLLSGMGGALALTAMTVAGRKIMSGQGGSDTDEKPDTQGLTAGEALSEEPDMPPSINEVTSTFVQKIATGLFGTTLSADQQYVAGVAWHLTYGGFWGMLYALLQSSMPMPRLLLSLLYGLGVWAIGPGWLVPKMKIMLPPNKQDPRTAAMMVSGHVAYGALLALGLRLLHGNGKS